MTGEKPFDSAQGKPFDAAQGKKKVDEDWKRRAQLEKEQDAAKAAGTPAPAAGGAKGPKPGKPSPHFAGLIESLASQALMFMGAIRDPMTGEAQTDLRQAQATIDLLNVLEEKTRGNLVKEEEDMLKQVLTEVRMHFVQLSGAGAQAPPPDAGLEE